MKIIFVILSSVFLIVLPCVNLSFAQSSSQYAQQFQQLLDQNWGNGKQISYAVYFVTSQSSCSDADYKALKYYQVISDEYLSLYQIQHDLAGSLCIPQKDLATYISGLSSYTLPIVIMDNTVGHQLLYQKGYYGLYEISGTGKESILVCACDAYLESFAGGWALSHELSHFALHYYGTPDLIYINWVHYVQALENGCQGFNFSKVCPDYSTAVTSPTGHQIPVMEIYGQGPTSYNMPSNAPQSDVMILPEASASTPEFGPSTVLVLGFSVVAIVLLTRLYNLGNNCRT